MHKPGLLVSPLSPNRTLVFCENDVSNGVGDNTQCVASVGNLEQMAKLRPLSVSSSPFTAARHRQVDNSVIEVVLGRGDGVVELWRKSESDWKMVVSSAVSSGIICCVEFLSNKLDVGDRASDAYTSYVLVVASDSLSVMVIPSSVGVDEDGIGARVQRLSLDIFNDASRSAKVAMLSREYVLIAYEAQLGRGKTESELKLAYIRIEWEQDQSTNIPKRMQLVERCVLPLNKGEVGSLRDFVLSQREEYSLPDVLVLTQLERNRGDAEGASGGSSRSGGLAVVRFESARSEGLSQTEGNLRYSLAGSSRWRTDVQGDDRCQLAVARLVVQDEESTGCQKRTYLLLSNGRRVVALEVIGSSLKQLGEVRLGNSGSSESGSLTMQLDSSSMDAAATFIRRTPAGLELNRVSLLRLLFADRDARARHLVNMLGSLVHARSSTSESAWPNGAGGMAELLTSARTGRELVRRAVEEALARLTDGNVPKIGTAAYFKGVRLLFAKVGLDALAMRGDPRNTLTLANPLDMWLYVQLVQMHALLIRVVTVTCQFETNNGDSQSGGENRFDKPQPVSGTLFNVAQLVHEAAAQHASVAKLFEIVDNALNVLLSATVPATPLRRSALDDHEPEHQVQDESVSGVEPRATANDVQFAVRFVRFFTLYLVEHALALGPGSRRTDLRFVSLPLCSDRLALQLVRECTTCIHLLATCTPNPAGGMRNSVMAPTDQPAFDSVCAAVSILSNSFSETAQSADYLSLPPNFRGELLAIRNELHDAHFTAWLNTNLLCFTSALRHAAASPAGDEAHESTPCWTSLPKARQLDEQRDDAPAKRKCLRSEREFAFDGDSSTRWDAVWCRPLRTERAVLTCFCCGALTARSRLRETAATGKLCSIWSLRCAKACPLCDGRWILI